MFSKTKWCGSTLIKSAANKIRGFKARLTGQQAETNAKDYLQKQGLDFIEQNFRCRRGELDLVMRDGEEFVFVEVKYRSNRSHGSAVDYFDARKKRKVETAIAYYMHQHQLNPSIVPHRLDLIAIDNERIDWIKQV